ncbi:MAG: hypothetical protein M3319_02950, partial [Actinomycetota bacterium]|nr:hypothetical protein [Actinomycetota bacterium]
RPHGKVDGVMSSSGDRGRVGIRVPVAACSEFSEREQLDELDESLDSGHSFVQPAQPAQAFDPRHRGEEHCEWFTPAFG